jgi:uncharacterized membrane protein YbhN (UPF0104 family)
MLIACIIVLSFVPNAINAAKLKFFLLRQPVSWSYLAVANFMSSAFTFVAPSGLGEDAVRLHRIGSNIGSYSTAATVLLSDRISSFAAQLAFTSVAFVAFGQRYAEFPLRCMACAGGLAATVVGVALMSGGIFFAARWFRKDRGIRVGPLRIETGEIQAYLRCLASDFPAISGVFSAALVFHAFLVAMIVVLSALWGRHLSVFEASMVILSGSMISTIPITFAGLGLMEGAYIAVYKAAEAGGETGLAVAMALRCAQVIAAIAGWVILVRHNLSAKALSHFRPQIDNGPSTDNPGI